MRVSLDELSRQLSKARLARGRVRAVERSDRDELVLVRDARGRRRVEPQDVRKAMGFSRIYSSRFTARTRGRSVQIRGRGFGHGVGMCQWGARGMALAKNSYRQILEYYYRGARVRRIY